MARLPEECETKVDERPSSRRCAWKLPGVPGSRFAVATSFILVYCCFIDRRPVVWRAKRRIRSRVSESQTRHLSTATLCPIYGASCMAPHAERTLCTIRPIYEGRTVPPRDVVSQGTTHLKVCLGLCESIDWVAWPPSGTPQRFFSLGKPFRCLRAASPQATLLDSAPFREEWEAGRRFRSQKIITVMRGLCSIYRVW